MNKTLEILTDAEAGVEYKLFLNAAGAPSVRVFDTEAEEVVTIISYPNLDAAKKAFADATRLSKK